MTIDLTPVFQAIIAIICALVTTYLIPWIKARTSVEKQEQISAWLEIAVYSAEKLWGSGHGSEKLAYARKVLEEHGFTFDESTLMALINAKIKQMEQNDVELIEDADQVFEEVAQE